MLTARVYNAIKSDVEYLRDQTIRYIKAKEMILEYLNSHSFIRNSDIQEMCGFTKQQSRNTLDKMREEKLLKLVKKGRNPTIFELFDKKSKKLESTRKR